MQSEEMFRQFCESVPPQNEVCRFADESGEMQSDCYKVFPGIELVYLDVHMPACSVFASSSAGEVLEIEHCREGRLECQDSGEYFYLAPGDISLRKQTSTERRLEFPLSHYHGISIRIDLSQTPHCLDCLLEGVKVRPKQLITRFGLDNESYFALRKLPSIEHIFAELYAVPETVRQGYLKVKVLEVLLFLSGLDAKQAGQAQNRFSHSQVKLAKSVYSYLTEHMEERITIAELSERFGVSPTQLKNNFRGVYGVSVQSCIREQKMQMAALLLKKTDRTIMDIAGQFGYSNASKFSGAFQNVIGSTPSRYRAENQII